MPILKQLVSGSSQSKRRSRLDLTTEMISAPLGDFRHTMHVGRGGDAFGDTSFLSSRSGEGPGEGMARPRSPRPGLLYRTFRSSKRSQSVTRADRSGDSLAPPGGSPTPVKNALSLPHLNDEAGEREGGVVKSLSSSLLQQPPEAGGDPPNGAATALDPEQEERRFGVLTDLPSPSATHTGAMRRTESVLSFHVDLGPSMLGEILDVMQREEDDLGFEEGGASPPHSTLGEGDEEQEEREEEEEEVEEEEEEEKVGDSQQNLLQPPGVEEVQNHMEEPRTLDSQPRDHPHLDSCSISSSGSAPLGEKPLDQLQGGDTDCAIYSSPPGEDESFFMEEEDDEIRV
ncbi:cdc42 effector protein 4-like [Megalops cyprinoides]|uniref:cdc42 effector protein 4-like n=1 Tax=Megalops cyprinoides TaxID=118141 RepID=UPI001863CCF4|nr:cdc42 effector protein 4-like [Megalops cyprinoides]